MLNSIHKYGEQILKHPGSAAAVAFSGAVLYDQLLGTHESHTRRNHPEFYATHPGNTRHTLVVLPGCQTDGKQYFKDVRFHTQKNTAVVGVDYPKHGFDAEAICEGLAAQLIKTKAERPSLLCQSMGGMIMRQFMHYADQTGLAEQVGGFDAIILDSSPFDSSDIRKPYRLLLGAASVGHRSWTADYLKRKISQSFRTPGANAHLDTIYSEGKYMKLGHDTRPLPRVMERVVYVSGQYDPVINSEQAAAKYDSVSPTGTFMHLVDESRPNPNHTAQGEQLDYLLVLAGVRRSLELTAA